MPQPQGYYDLPGSKVLPGGNLAVSPGMSGQPRSISGIDIPTPGQYVPNLTGLDYSNTIPAEYRKPAFPGPGLVNNPLPGFGQYFQYLTQNDAPYITGMSAGSSAQTPSYQNSPTPDTSVYAPGGNNNYPRATPANTPITAYPAAEPVPDLYNAPMVTGPEYYNDPMTQWPGASSVNRGVAPGISPYPMPGGFGTPSKGFFGDLLSQLFGGPKPGVASSFDPATGQNWATNAAGQPSGTAIDQPSLQNQPLPAVQQLLFGNQQSGRTQPSPSNPTGTYGFGPNYVDPIEAGQFIPGLVNWNAMGATQGISAAGEAGLGGFGRAPVTAQQARHAAALRGSGIGAVPGMSAKGQ